jgi:hypothetical protein
MQGMSRLRLGSRPRFRGRTLERGQGIVEFAAIFPIFIVLVFVMIDGGLLMGRYNQVNHSAQEGARLAASGASLTDVVDHVQDQSIDLLGGASSSCSSGQPERICVEWWSGRNGSGEVGSYVRVTVFYDYNPVTPLDAGIFGMVGFPDHWDVDSCAIATLERPTNVPNGRSRNGTPTC